MNPAKQHSDACKAVRNHLRARGYIVYANLAVGRGGRADREVVGNGPCVLFLEIKTGAAKLSPGQREEQIILDKRMALYRMARVNHLPGSRNYDFSQVDAAVAELNRLNGILLAALGKATENNP